MYFSREEYLLLSAHLTSYDILYFTSSILHTFTDAWKIIFPEEKYRFKKIPSMCSCCYNIARESDQPVDPSPRNHRNPALLPRRDVLQYPVAPNDVGVVGEGVYAAVGQGHRYDRLGSGVLESSISSSAEGYRYGKVLSLRLIRLDSCGIVVKRLPMRGVGVPVETSGLNIHTEKGLQAFNDQGEGRTVFFPTCFIISDEMRSLNLIVAMP